MEKHKLIYKKRNIFEKNYKVNLLYLFHQKEVGKRLDKEENIMKKRTIKLISLLCVAVLAMGAFVGCGSKKADTAKTDDTKQEASKDTEKEETKDDADESESGEATSDGTIEGLLKTLEGEDAHMILSGVGDGWAPTAMVLLNDGTFYCLVDYAGQATVNFATGDWTENADGSITATGALYTDGSELDYEIAKNGDEYTTSLQIPDTETSVDLTGTVAE